MPARVHAAKDACTSETTEYIYIYIYLRVLWWTLSVYPCKKLARRIFTRGCTVGAGASAIKTVLRSCPLNRQLIASLVSIFWWQVIKTCDVSKLLGKCRLEWWKYLRYELHTGGRTIGTSTECSILVLISDCSCCSQSQHIVQFAFLVTCAYF